MDSRILYIDLCSRLPYGVKVDLFGETKELFGLDNSFPPVARVGYDINNCEPVPLEDIRPFLRPLSSMTDDEFSQLKERSGLKYDQLELGVYGPYSCLDFYLSEIPTDVVILVFDWLNEHHFDYRGLIEQGLAIGVDKDSNPYI